MTEGKRKNIVHSGTIGGDADPSTIDTVYIGVPDILEPEEVIRFHALSFALSPGAFGFDEDKTEDRILSRARKFEQFIKGE